MFINNGGFFYMLLYRLSVKNYKNKLELISSGSIAV